MFAFVLFYIMEKMILFRNLQYTFKLERKLLSLHCLCLFLLATTSSFKIISGASAYVHWEEIDEVFAVGGNCSKGMKK